VSKKSNPTKELRELRELRKAARALLESTEFQVEDLSHLDTTTLDAAEKLQKLLGIKAFTPPVREVPDE